jgi:hypothetical protein
MPANYVVIRDAPVTLSSPNGDRDRDFDFDADGARDDRATVLVWRVAPGDPAAEVTVTLNGTLVQKVGFGSTVERTFHEAVEAGVLKETGNNILFEVTPGSGKVTFSDVIWWYKQP